MESPNQEILEQLIKTFKDQTSNEDILYLWIALARVAGSDEKADPYYVGIHELIKEQIIEALESNRDPKDLIKLEEAFKKLDFIPQNFFDPNSGDGNPNSLFNKLEKLANRVFNDLEPVRYELNSLLESERLGVLFELITVFKNETRDNIFTEKNAKNIGDLFSLFKEPYTILIGEHLLMVHLDKVAFEMIVPHLSNARNIINELAKSPVL